MQAGSHSLHGEGSLVRTTGLALATGAWIDASEPVVALGHSGTGKTHLLIGLGLAACEQGRRVRDATAAALVNELAEAADNRQLSRVVARYGRLDLLLLDELGYVRLDARGAELLFQIITERDEKASTGLATSLPFSEWGSVFPDPRLVAAIVDRVTFNARILETGTQSCRLTAGKNAARRKRARLTRSQPARAGPAPIHSGMLDDMTHPGASRIYEVRRESPKGQVHAFGARRTQAQAEVLLAESIRKFEAAGGHNNRYWIEEIHTTGLWQPPPQPKPRERYTTRVTTTKKPPSWETVHVDVLDGETVIASYDRNYRMLQTFEPFRQGDRIFALISTHYTATSVMDLHTGQIVAAEEPAGGGFCPVGFYVPDWWDLHDGTKLPGSMYWLPADDQWPAGDFGFVWGCIWGDDSSWKVQYLDLSHVADGVIRRDDRFGYLKLATDPKLEPQDFIRCSSWQGERRVEFYIERGFNLTTGAPIPDEDW